MSDEDEGTAGYTRQTIRRHFRNLTIIHGIFGLTFLVLGIVCLVQHDGRSNPPYFIGTFFTGVILIALTVISALIYMNVLQAEVDEGKNKEVKKLVFYNNRVCLSITMVYILSIIIVAVKGLTYGNKDKFDFDYLDEDYTNIAQDPVAEVNKKLALAILLLSLAGSALNLYAVILSYKTASALNVNLIKRRGLTGFNPNNNGNDVTNMADYHVTGDHEDESFINNTNGNSDPAPNRPYQPIPLDLVPSSQSDGPHVYQNEPQPNPSAPPPTYAEVMESN